MVQIGAISRFSPALPARAELCPGKQRVEGAQGVRVVRLSFGVLCDSSQTRSLQKLCLAGCVPAMWILWAAFSHQTEKSDLCNPAYSFGLTF